MLGTIFRTTILLACLLVIQPLPAPCAEYPPADYTEPVTSMEFMAVPGGTFTMGDNQDRHAQPVHTVTVRPFMLGRYEVTFEQYAKFCSSTGRLIPADGGWGMGNRPAINVSWQDAVDFTKWLSEKTGERFRLPSEAEWEYAARGGSKTKFPWGDEIGRNMANCSGCGSEWGGRGTGPVGTHAPNGYGLYDMIGNVYEWCADVYHDIYLGAPADGSAWISDAVDDSRINRGGSWLEQVREMEITRRCWNREDTRRNEIGFRVVLER
jgi:formylglycine-generating enzyme required for sulfatase activity